MLISKKFLICAAALAAAAWASAATAQPASCAEDDLRCRIAALEARVAQLESAPASQPQVVYEAPTESVNVRRTCRSDCHAEAAAICTERGFSGGRAEDWERPRSGPVVLTRAQCNRQTP
ncbi:MAG: hypothetical protein ABW199_12620 [Caulobacterales bacterium]